MNDENLLEYIVELRFLNVKGHDLIDLRTHQGNGPPDKLNKICVFPTQ